MLASGKVVLSVRVDPVLRDEARVVLLRRGVSLQSFVEGALRALTEGDSGGREDGARAYEHPASLAVKGTSGNGDPKRLPAETVSPSVSVPSVVQSLPDTSGMVLPSKRVFSGPDPKVRK